jgi:carbon monoxide dehydrogenase subunit G
VAAPPEVVFDLLSDMARHDRWVPGPEQFGQTTDVEPYPVRFGITAAIRALSSSAARRSCSLSAGAS